MSGTVSALIVEVIRAAACRRAGIDSRPLPGLPSEYQGTMEVKMAEQSKPVLKNVDDAIMGLVAGVTTVMEILVMRKLLTDQQLREMLSIVQEKFVERRQPDAGAVIGLMLQTFGEQREAARSLLTKPPEGTA